MEEGTALLHLIMVHSCFGVITKLASLETGRDLLLKALIPVKSLSIDIMWKMWFLGLIQVELLLKIQEM